MVNHKQALGISWLLEKRQTNQARASENHAYDAVAVNVLPHLEQVLKHVQPPWSPKNHIHPLHAIDGTLVDSFEESSLHLVMTTLLCHRQETTRGS